VFLGAVVVKQRVLQRTLQKPDGHEWPPVQQGLHMLLVSPSPKQESKDDGGSHYVSSEYDGERLRQCNNTHQPDDE
jgi:hypothetical protein